MFSKPLLLLIVTAPQTKKSIFTKQRKRTRIGIHFKFFWIKLWKNLRRQSQIDIFSDKYELYTFKNL